MIDEKLDAEENAIRKDHTYAYPLRWWVDDLNHRVCGIVDDPIIGLDTIPWPDSEKVYIAIDEEYHNQCLGWWYAEASRLSLKDVRIGEVEFPALLERMKKDLAK